MDFQKPLEPILTEPLFHKEINKMSSKTDFKQIHKDINRMSTRNNFKLKSLSNKSEEIQDNFEETSNKTKGKKNISLKFHHKMALT